MKYISKKQVLSFIRRQYALIGNDSMSNMNNMGIWEIIILITDSSNDMAKIAKISKSNKISVKFSQIKAVKSDNIWKARKKALFSPMGQNRVGFKAI